MLAVKVENLVSRHHAVGEAHFEIERLVFIKRPELLLKAADRERVIAADHEAANAWHIAAMRLQKSDGDDRRFKRLSDRQP